MQSDMKEMPRNVGYLFQVAIILPSEAKTILMTIIFSVIRGTVSLVITIYGKFLLTPEMKIIFEFHLNSSLMRFPIFDSLKFFNNIYDNMQITVIL